MATKKAELSVKAKEILEVLKNAEQPMTAHDFKLMGISANGSSFRALEDRGYITSNETTIEVVKTRKVKAYQVVGEDEDVSEDVSETE